MADAETPLLCISDLSLRYDTARGKVRALDHVSLTLQRGRAMGLVGESGSGKSSLVLAMLGLLGNGAELAAAEARFDGQDLLADAAALRGRRIGMVFQDPAAALNPGLTIGYQIAEPLIHHRRMPEREALARAVALLTEVGVARAEAVARSYPHQLSGGMKQRAVIATALACEPELLLLDEPTTALDVTVEAQILDLLDQLRRQRGVSLLLVSHNLGIVDRLCDEVTVLYAGRVVEQGATEDILSAPRHPYTRGLLAALPRADEGRLARLAPIPGGLPDLTVDEPGCNFRPRCAFATEACTAPQPIAAKGGHLVRCVQAERVRTISLPIEEVPATSERVTAPGKPMLQATELSRSFRLGGPLSLSFRHGLPRLQPAAEVVAVDNVSFHVARGEALGLVGESGCGKSTLGRLVLRLLAANAGRISLDGQVVPDVPSRDFRRRAQIVFQNPDSSLNPRHTVHQALRWPIIRFGVASGAAADWEVDRLLELVRLPSSYRSRYPHQMSGGEKQRIGIARALASQPDFLVCDEAVSALDVSVQAAVLNLLADLRDRLGLAYLFISHDIGVIAHIADRIAVMYRGVIVEQGSTAQVLVPPYHPYTEALLSSVPLVGAKGRSLHRVRLAGDASAVPPPGGCSFAPRCPRHMGAICDTVLPPLRLSADGHQIACHHPIETLATMPPALGQAA